MHRRFDVDLYRSEAARWNVEKFVNVAAATGRHSVDETIALDRDAAAAGGPDAIIGGLPPTDSVAESLQLIDHQMTASRFRGVRPMGRLDQPLPAAEVLRGLAERNLVFELMTHPDQLASSAAGLAGVDDLTVVVEHTGWPRSDSAEEFALWKSGIDALAAVGPQVVCKLSGLAMPFGSMQRRCPGAVARLRPRGLRRRRCFFASNFPVDAVYGTFDELYTTFSDLTAGLDEASRAKLFAENAERIYRL